MLDQNFIFLTWFIKRINKVIKDRGVGDFTRPWSSSTSSGAASSGGALLQRRRRVSLIDPMQWVAVAAKNERLPQQSLVIVVACLSEFYSRSHMLDFYFSPIIDSNNRI
jgi:hypothetical protein